MNLLRTNTSALVSRINTFNSTDKSEVEDRMDIIFKKNNNNV